MARPTYLQRIAEPLRPGEPVLFAVPRPAPDEARPAAETPSVGPSAPLRRSAAAPRAAATQTDAASPRRQAGAVATLADGELTPARPAGSAARPAVDRDETRARRLPAPGSVAATAGEAIAPEPRSMARPPLASTSGVLRDASLRAAPQHEEVLDGTKEDLSLRSRHRRRLEGRTESIQAAGIPAAAVEHPPSLAPSPPGSTAPPPSPSPSTAPPSPRLHIGTIEVRSAAPPPPPVARAAPQPGAAALSRGYGWRFGLVQG
jgi:actin cytoskeleton-regulatory complex protein PAN1